MTPRSRRTPPTMNFSEDVKYYLKILYDEYFPQHHAKITEESGEAQRERYALMRSRCSEVPHKMSFREDDTLEKSRTSAPFLHHNTHTSLEKKKERNLFSFVVTFSYLLAFIALLFSFASLSSRRSCGWSCIPFREAYGVRDTTCLGFSFRIRSGARAKGTTTTRKGKKSPRR